MKVLVLGAGGPAGVNTVHALHMAGHYVIGADANERHLVWPDCWTLHMPESGLLHWVNEVIAENGIELVWPQPDSLVLWTAQHRDQLEAPVYLPSTGTILYCQDKFETGWRWAKAGLRAPVMRIDTVDDLKDAEYAFDLPFWLRATNGAGARGATVCESRAMAESWFRYWLERGVTWEWVAEEYLPGRDYAWTGLYSNGQLVTSSARERLEYIFPHLAPSGRTGTPIIASIVHDERVNLVSEFAVDVIDKHPHGVYCVDLREDSDGFPRPTEINAGRTCTTVPLYARVGFNIPAAVCSLVAGESPPLPVRDAIAAGVTLSRHIDCPAVFTTAKDPVCV